MIRKFHNHKVQTNPWHREEEQHNNHETPGRQTKQTTCSLYPIMMIAKLEWTQSNAQQNINRTITLSRNWSNNQQQINNRTTALARTTAKATAAFTYEI